MEGKIEQGREQERGGDREWERQRETETDMPAAGEGKE